MTDLHTEVDYAFLNYKIKDQGICNNIVAHGSLHLKIYYKTFKNPEQDLFV